MSEVDLCDLLKISLDHSIDLRSRTIYLIGEVELDWVTTTVQYLHMFSSPKYFRNNTDPINLIINSPGGSDDMAFCLYDAIQTCGSPVHTIGTGMVCSAATLILSCGHKRFGTENLWLMTHKGSVIVSGDDDSIMSQAKLQNKVADRYWKLLERHTKKPALSWYRNSRDHGELWLNAEQSLEWGVIDEIIPSTRSFEPLSNRMIKDLIKREDDDAE